MTLIDARRRGGPRRVVLLFPGQGSQHPGMATGLYRREPVFTEAMDEVFELMGQPAAAIRGDWLGHTELVDIDDVRRAQPLLFAVDYALGRLVHSWGVRPAALLGHSAGELVAATFAGVFTLAEAVAAQMDRVALAAEVPPGGMLAVAASAAQLAPYIDDTVVIAAVNAPRQTMLAGPRPEILGVAQRLHDDGFVVATVPATSPFHSPAMLPVAEAAELDLRHLPLRPPAVPLYSGYTAGLMGADATSPRFWARQVVDPVLFGAALSALLDEDDALLLETGPGQTLTSFARRQRAVRTGRSEAVALLPSRSAVRDHDDVLDAVSRLRSEGHAVDTSASSLRRASGSPPSARLASR